MTTAPRALDACEIAFDVVALCVCWVAVAMLWSGARGQAASAGMPTLSTDALAAFLSSPPSPSVALAWLLAWTEAVLAATAAVVLAVSAFQGTWRTLRRIAR